MGRAIGSARERERIVGILKSMDFAQGMAAHNEKPSSVCRICRAVTLIEGETA
jgi:hypothetical protein